MKDKENKTALMLAKYVEDKTSKFDSYPAVVAKALGCISGTMPFKMKLGVVLSELMTFTSHLRKPIGLSDGTLVPVNSIFFILSGSGTGKDKALNAIRKSLSVGYEQLEGKRKEYARTKAESKAMLEGDTKEEWAKYYVAPKSLQAGLGTETGLVAYFAELAENPIAAASVMSNEIGSELQTNGNIVDIIKMLSVAFDLGNIPAKIVKSAESQTAEVKSLPVSAILFGSEQAILFDAAIKNKFKLMFNTQLARRSMFTYTPELPTPLHIDSIQELYTLREVERVRVGKVQDELNTLTGELVDNTSNTPLEISDDAMLLFDVYLEHNIFLSQNILNKYPISKLSRQHKYWLALKLSGAYAILDNSEYISEEHYCYAINTVELLANDLMTFEEELVKEPYEQLASMCKTNSENGEYILTLHELRKLSYVTGTSASKARVEELCVLANSYDELGAYTEHDGGILYKEIIKTDVVGVSHLMFNTDLVGKELKDHMNRNCKDGYTFFETDFSDLENLLSENAAYSPFQFIDGIRKGENLIGATKLIVLDIDKSNISDTEAHILLSDYNHHIARTSDKENEYKFRVLLELDAPVDVDSVTWKALVQEVANELGLVSDSLPKSQIYLSYAGRNVLSQLEGEPIKLKHVLERTVVNLKDKPKPVSTLPAKAKKALLDDPRVTFSYAFEAESNRSITMYRALLHAVDLGADKEHVEALALSINKYWPIPLDEDRLYRTLITPILRKIQ